MDWKTWRRTIAEADNSNVIPMPKDLQVAKELIDDLLSKKIIFFDLETTGFDGKHNQITQIGSLVQEPGQPILKMSQINKANSFNTKANLLSVMKQRLTPGTGENIIWTKEQLRSGMVKRDILQLNDKLSDMGITDIPVKDLLNLAYDEELTLEEIEQEKNKIFKKIKIYKNKFSNSKAGPVLSSLEKKIKTSIDPAYVFSLTGYGVKSKDKKKMEKKEEHEVIVDFIKYLKANSDSDTFLTGHNIKNFDIKFINDRIDSVNDKFNLNLPKPDQMFSGRTFDTVEMSRSVFLPSIKELKKYFDKMAPISEELDPKQNIEKELENSTQQQRIEVYNNLLGHIKNELNNKVIPALTTSGGRMSSSQGVIAKSLDIDAEGWHDALADVLMLSNVLQGMKIIIDLALSRQEPEKLQEMEPYQKMVTAKHPEAKKRLTGHGQVKDKSTPYKYKLSLKRGKSAPPIGE